MLNYASDLGVTINKHDITDLCFRVGEHGVYVDLVSGGDPHDVSQVLREVVWRREELVPNNIS